MTAPGIDEKFTARETTWILRRAGLDVTEENLRDWHRRKILPGAPVGRGRDRSYAFGELVYLASLAFVAPHVRYGGLAAARGVAQQLTHAIMEAYGFDRKLTTQAQTYALVYSVQDRTVALEPVEGKRTVSLFGAQYKFEGAVVVHPGYMALELFKWVRDALARRAGFLNFADQQAKETAK